MIDIENIVYNNVATAVRAAFGTAYPDLTCDSEYVESPSGFPHVSVYEMNNVTLDKTLTDALVEHHARVTFEINVYTNNGGGRKLLAKDIADVVDTAMLGMKFRRTLSIVTPNIDRSIYRKTMRYEAIVAAGVTSIVDGEEMTTYQMYRR